MRSARRAFSTLPHGGVNVARWPIHKLASSEGRAVVAAARAELERTGCASFPHFLAPAALAAASAEAVSNAPRAYVTDATHNAFQAADPDDTLPPRHVRNLQMRTRVASTAFDELRPDSALRALYRWHGLTPFLSAVLGGAPVYPLADALGCCSVNVFREGWEHAWHFDEAETTVTLCLQTAERGGEFEFSPLLRNSDVDLAEPAVRALLKHHSNYDPVPAPEAGGEEEEEEEEEECPPVATAHYEAGTLQVFRGRYCLHRVTATEGARDRLSAVLCFADEPGVFNSPSVQSMFWGREKAPLAFDEMHT